MAFNYPWTNLHELNLNWVLNQIKKLSKQVTNVVDMTATAHSLPGTSDPTVDVTGGNGDEPYNFDFGIPAGGGGGAVDSVNGQTGTVVLDKDDIGLSNVANVAQYSASNPPPYPVTSVNGQTGAVVVSGGAVDSVNGQTGTVVLDKDDIGLSNVANVAQYSASNPPPYPVTSVNGMTGDVIVQGGGGGSDVLSVNGKVGVVVLDSTDIGLGNVDNVQQYSATNPPPYPVASVNGQTGAVVLDKDDIGLSNVANVAQYSASNPPPYPVTSVNGMTGDVIVQGGGGASGTKQTANIISLYPTDITVQSAYMVVIGDLITYSVKFRNNHSSNLNMACLSNFSKPLISGNDYGASATLAYNNKTYPAYINSGGALVIPSSSGIPMGDFTVTATYIKN